MPGLPDVTEVRLWCRAAPTSITDAQLAQVIDAEAINQSLVCRVPVAPDEYPSDLAQALLRRVARALSARGVPLGLVGDPASEAGQLRLGQFDAEVERHEGPRRLVVFG